MSRTLLSLAGFQVILSGRFWVIAEENKKLIGFCFAKTLVPLPQVYINWRGHVIALTLSLQAVARLRGRVADPSELRIGGVCPPLRWTEDSGSESGIPLRDLPSH